MIKTRNLIEFLENIHTLDKPLFDAETTKIEQEKIRIIIRRLKDLDILRKGVDDLHVEMIAGEMFENNE